MVYYAMSASVARLYLCKMAVVEGVDGVDVHVV